jgi:hypothetical protein
MEEGEVIEVVCARLIIIFLPLSSDLNVFLSSLSL